MQKKAKKVKPHTVSKSGAGARVKRRKPLKREFSSGGVVVRKTGNSFAVLLIKDSYGRWTWPKGHIDKNESSEEAALREISEEVGIENTVIIGKIGQQQYFYKLKGDLVFKTVFIYLCETKQTRLTIQDSEIDDGMWFSPEDAIKKIEYRGSGVLLKKALNRFASMNSFTLKGKD